MMTPKVSIVFTSYNHKQFLKQAIDSLLLQTFKDFELIIVDDCSTDGSQEVLKSYKDPRIQLHLKERNGGSYVLSTNYGASYATAPYIIFAQCDDWAEPHQLERLVEKMEHNDVGVVFSCSNMVDEQGCFMGVDFDKRERKFRQYFYEDSIIERSIAQSLFFHSCIIPNLSAALVKRELFEVLNGLSPDYFVLADWDFWLRMTKMCDFYYIREPLNNFRQHSQTIRSSVKTKKQIDELFRMIFDFSKSSEISPVKASHIAANLWIRWSVAGLGSWLRNFPALLLKGIKYSLYFPIAALVEFPKVVFSKLVFK